MKDRSFDAERLPQAVQVDLQRLHTSIAIGARPERVDHRAHRDGGLTGSEHREQLEKAQRHLPVAEHRRRIGLDPCSAEQPDPDRPGPALEIVMGHRGPEVPHADHRTDVIDLDIVTKRRRTQIGDPRFGVKRDERQHSTRSQPREALLERPSRERVIALCQSKLGRDEMGEAADDPGVVGKARFFVEQGQSLDAISALEGDTSGEGQREAERERISQLPNSVEQHAEIACRLGQTSIDVRAKRLKIEERSAIDGAPARGGLELREEQA